MAYLDNEDRSKMATYPVHLACWDTEHSAEIGGRGRSYRRDKTAKGDGTNLQYFRVSRATGRDIQRESSPRASTMMRISGLNISWICVASGNNNVMRSRYKTKYSSAREQNKYIRTIPDCKSEETGRKCCYLYAVRSESDRKLGKYVNGIRYSTEMWIAPERDTFQVLTTSERALSLFARFFFTRPPSLLSFPLRSVRIDTLLRKRWFHATPG